MADPTQRVRSSAGKSGSSVQSEPFDHLIQHIKQSDPMLYEALHHFGLQVTNATSVLKKIAAAPVVASGELFLRTIDIKDTTVGNDIADATVIHGSTGKSMTCMLVTGVLRAAITSNLTVRLNLWVAGISSVVGTFTIPLATPINTAVKFTAFTTPIFPELSVLTWDITASDASKDPNGVASLSVWYQ